MTLDEFFLVYMGGVENKPSVVAQKRLMYARSFGPWIGHRNLDEISPVDVYTCLTKLKTQSLSPKTQNNYLTLLRNVLKLAKELELIARVPDVKRQREPSGMDSVRFLSHDECERLIGRAGEWAPMIAFACVTGLRIGELRALQWKHVIASSKQLDIRVATCGRFNVIGTTKGKPRLVPIGKTAAKILDALDRGTQFVFVRKYRRLQPPAPLSYKACDLGLKRAGAAAGIRGLHWHVLRHTFASHLALAGASIQKIKDLLGHVDISVTMKYSHLTPSALAETVSLLDKP